MWILLSLALFAPWYLHAAEIDEKGHDRHKYLEEVLQWLHGERERENNEKKEQLDYVLKRKRAEMLELYISLRGAILSGGDILDLHTNFIEAVIRGGYAEFVQRVKEATSSSPDEIDHVFYDRLLNRLNDMNLEFERDVRERFDRQEERRLSNKHLLGKGFFFGGGISSLLAFIFSDKINRMDGSRYSAPFVIGCGLLLMTYGARDLYHCERDGQRQLRLDEAMRRSEYWIYHDLNDNIGGLLREWNDIKMKQSKMDE